MINAYRNKILKATIYDIDKCLKEETNCAAYIGYWTFNLLKFRSCATSKAYSIVYIMCWCLGCQVGAVGRGLDCQPCGWQINSQLGKIAKKPSASCYPKKYWDFRCPVYHNNIMGTLKICLCPSHIGQVLRLPGALSPDVLRFASLWITLTAPEVNKVTLINFPAWTDIRMILDL